MTQHAVADALSGALAQLGIETRELRPEVRLYQDLGLDSTEMVMVTLELTRRLGVRVKLGARTDLTFAQVCETVTQQVDGEASGGRPPLPEPPLLSGTFGAPPAHPSGPGATPGDPGITDSHTRAEPLFTATPRSSRGRPEDLA